MAVSLNTADAPAITGHKDQYPHPRSSRRVSPSTGHRPDRRVIPGRPPQRKSPGRPHPESAKAELYGDEDDKVLFNDDLSLVRFYT
jgi:hypothetical protein